MEGIHFQTSGNHDGKHLFHAFGNSKRTAAWYFCRIKEKQVAGLSDFHTCHGIYFRSVLCICTVNPVFALL